MREEKILLAPHPADHRAVRIPAAPEPSIPWAIRPVPPALWMPALHSP